MAAQAARASFLVIIVFLLRFHPSTSSVFGAAFRIYENKGAKHGFLLDGKIATAVSWVQCTPGAITKGQPALEIILRELGGNDLHSDRLCDRRRHIQCLAILRPQTSSCLVYLLSNCSRCTILPQ
jgi:hypothetical protein